MIRVVLVDHGGEAVTHPPVASRVDRCQRGLLVPLGQVVGDLDSVLALAGEHFGDDRYALALETLGLCLAPLSHDDHGGEEATAATNVAASHHKVDATPGPHGLELDARVRLWHRIGSREGPLRG